MSVPLVILCFASLFAILSDNFKSAPISALPNLGFINGKKLKIIERFAAAGSPNFLSAIDTGMLIANSARISKVSLVAKLVPIPAVKYSIATNATILATI